MAVMQSYLAQSRGITHVSLQLIQCTLGVFQVGAGIVTAAAFRFRRWNAARLGAEAALLMLGEE